MKVLITFEIPGGISYLPYNNLPILFTSGSQDSVDNTRPLYINHLAPNSLRWAPDSWPSYSKTTFDRSRIHQPHELAAPPSTWPSQDGSGSNTKSHQAPYGVSTSLSLYEKPSTSKHFSCTVCGHRFQDYASWKKHEKVKHEKDEVWHCGDCSALFFEKTQFFKHHIERHLCCQCQLHMTTRCKSRRRQSNECVGCSHANQAHLAIFTPDAYSCGFCEMLEPFPNWNERCKHVSRHFVERKTISQWDHSKVIRTLLFSRQLLHNAFWEHVGNNSRDYRQSATQFFWVRSDTEELLRDLKCWKTGHDVSALAKQAYDLSKANPDDIMPSSSIRQAPKLPKPAEDPSPFSSQYGGAASANCWPRNMTQTLQEHLDIEQPRFHQNSSSSVEKEEIDYHYSGCYLPHSLSPPSGK
jgi:hypothetical protein